MRQILHVCTIQISIRKRVSSSTGSSGGSDCGGSSRGSSNSSEYSVVVIARVSWKGEVRAWIN